MTKRNIGILAGGFEAERVISMKSAQVVKKNLDPEKFNTYIIDIQRGRWVSEGGTPIDKNDFSLTDKGEKLKFDACFMAIHGSPVEDGKIQGYLEMLNIPYTGCDGRTMAITMDKILTKQILGNTFGVRTAKFLSFQQGDEIHIDQMEELGYPFFIKPNSAGSSFGVTKVKEQGQIEKAIREAILHDRQLIIEEFIEGREFSHGVLQEGKQLHILPPTEIIPENEFFDYEAKYEGKSKEITPAPNLSENLRNQMYQITETIFRRMGCQGLARIDYLLRGDELFFMEVNTIPGLSEASIYPQQLIHYGLSLSQSFEIMIENALMPPQKL